MSETTETWPDEVREACFGTCGGLVGQHAPHEDIGCSMFEDTLRALAPYAVPRRDVATMLDRARAEGAEKALREAAEALWTPDESDQDWLDDPAACVRDWLRERANRVGGAS